MRSVCVSVWTHCASNSYILPSFPWFLLSFAACCKEKTRKINVTLLWYFGNSLSSYVVSSGVYFWNARNLLFFCHSSVLNKLVFIKMKKVDAPFWIRFGCEWMLRRESSSSSSLVTWFRSTKLTLIKQGPLWKLKKKILLYTRDIDLEFFSSLSHCAQCFSFLVLQRSRL